MTSKIFIGLTAGLLLWQLLVLLRPRKVSIMTDVKWYIPPKVWIGLTILLLGSQVWFMAFPKHADTPKTAAVTQSLPQSGLNNTTANAAGSAQAEPTESNRILRFILWLNLGLALPWITAHIVRWVLDRKSNFASFILMLGYTLIDIVLAMVIAHFSFIGGYGAVKLMILLCLSAGYNYWTCEAIARMWLNSSRSA